MSEGTSGNANVNPVLETLDEAECLRLISPGGIGRLAERAVVLESGVEPWPGGAREHAIRIVPTTITGRRLSHRPAARSS